MSTQDPNPSSPDPYGTPQAPRYDQGQPYGQNDPAQQGGYPAAPAYSGQQGGQQGLQGGAPKNGLGLAALIVGIVSLVIAWIPFVGFLGLVAIVLGIIGLRRVKARVATNKGMALAGLILGVLATLAAIAWIAAIVFFASNVDEDCLDPNLTQAQQQQCTVDSFS